MQLLSPGFGPAGASVLHHARVAGSNRALSSLLSLPQSASLSLSAWLFELCYFTFRCGEASTCLNKVFSLSRKKNPCHNSKEGKLMLSPGWVSPVVGQDMSFCQRCCVELGRRHTCPCSHVVFHKRSLPLLQLLPIHFSSHMWFRGSNLITCC